MIHSRSVRRNMQDIQGSAHLDINQEINFFVGGAKADMSGAPPLVPTSTICSVGKRVVRLRADRGSSSDSLPSTRDVEERGETDRRGVLHRVSIRPDRSSRLASRRRSSPLIDHQAHPGPRQRDQLLARRYQLHRSQGDGADTAGVVVAGVSASTASRSRAVSCAHLPVLYFCGSASAALKSARARVPSPFLA